MGLFFSKKRSDGKVVKGEDPLIRMTPFIMRGRNEAVIYFPRSYDIEAIQTFIQDQRARGKRITLFNIIAASMLQTIFRRPKINRFIAGRRLYEHNDVSILYAVKARMTDDALESIAKVEFNPDDTIYDVAERMKSNTDMIKDGKLKTDDKFIHFVSKLPRSILQFALWIIRLMDFYGIMPKALMDAIPLYSSVYISHIGSVGADAPFHHLYEFGTTSIFITIGRVYEAPYKNKDGELEWRQTVDLKFSIDERICDGFYLIKSMKVFDKFMNNPSLLELSPKEHDEIHEKRMERIRQRRDKRANLSKDADTNTIS
ncbi:MAG TPA: 2-oxo acid dehydrogenase subunit E2 [Clostridiaceae bacterium]|nr:2-oxo acid dehydrogenase subunit E2 [Clostridiaceae bacterium]